MRGVSPTGVPANGGDRGREQLRKTAELVARSGKGIAACDESAGTMGERFAKVGIDNTEENRRLYRCAPPVSLRCLGLVVRARALLLLLDACYRMRLPPCRLVLRNVWLSIVREARLLRLSLSLSPAR